MIIQVITEIHHVISYIGIGIILWGVVRSVLDIVNNYVSKKKDTFFRSARMVLCQHIVFGLEFMVAGDVIRTIILPDYHTLAILGGLVVIRTVLSYFVDIELRHLRKM